MTVPENIWLFRMVHWQNVEHILKHGMCCKGHELEDPNYINIGHRQLIADRHDYPIPISDAGTLGQYVPFYFAGHSPMLYLIQHGYAGVTQRSQEDIVFIAVSFQKVKDYQLEFVFSDRNAKISLANFYNDETGFEKLNWDVIQNRDWANTEEDFERKDLKQAEFLIRSFVPVKCIAYLIVKTEARKQFFKEIVHTLELDIQVSLDPKHKLYY